MKTSRRLLVAIAISSWACASALADGIFLGPGESDRLAVFGPTGALVGQVSVSEVDESRTTVYFINDPTLADPAQWGIPAVVYEEGQGAVPTVVSDFFGVWQSQGSFYLAFQSDGEGLVPPLDPGFGADPPGLLVEGPSNNGVFDATMFLNPTLQAQGYTAEFISDVPEASTWTAIVAVGVFAGLRSRRRP